MANHANCLIIINNKYKYYINVLNFANWIWKIMQFSIIQVMNQMKVLIIFTLLLSLAFSQCDSSQYLYADTCLNSCPSSTVIQHGDFGFYCLECQLTKMFVQNADGTNCVCSNQTYLNVFGDECLPCHYSCLSCSGPSRNDCLTCDTETSSTFRIKFNSSCLCQLGYFDNQNASAPVCQKCHIDCASCFGPLETDCIDCAAGKYKNQLGLCSCDRQFVSNQDGICICPPPLVVMPDGYCKNPTNQCAYGQQLVKLTNIAKISKKGKPFGCVCSPGLYKIKGQCRPCNINQQYSDIKGICKCIPGAVHYNKQCIYCSNDQIFDSLTGKCRCKKNYQMTEMGTCVKCPPKQFYVNGTCSCVFNYYRSLISGKCVKCTKNSDNPLCVENPEQFDQVTLLKLSDLMTSPAYGPPSYNNGRKSSNSSL